MPHATGHGGTRLHYEVLGDEGPFVVLIQGLGLSSRFWFDLPERLVAERDDPYRVIVLDNRGVGRSERPRGPYRMAQMADDVAAVLDAAGARTAYVVGISMGGMIAQHVALRHPDRVLGLVLLATTCGLPHGSLPRARTIATLLAMPLSRKTAGRALASLLLPKSHLPRAREILAKWPAAMRAEPTNPAAFFAQLAAVLGHSTGWRLKDIRCPTVVVTGDDDVLVPAKNSRVIAARIPGAHLEEIPSCGHGIPLLDEKVVHRSLQMLRRSRARVAA